MKTSYTLAIVGVGKIARDQHLPAIAGNPGFELVASASRHAQVENVRNYTDIGALLAAESGLDAVSLCAPPQVRYEQARAALEAGKHVMLEKPPGASVSEVEALRDLELIVRAAKRSATIPSYLGLRLPLTTHLADRVRAMLVDRAGWARFPDDVREWLEVQDWRSQMPGPGNLLVESFPHARRHYTVYYTFTGWNANQSLGMLITNRMEQRGLLPGGFVANDYSLAVWGLKPVEDPRPLLSPDILTHEFLDWVQESHILRRAFREVAVIAGLVERQHPGKRKSGKQVTFSTDLIYDVLRKYEPDHVLIEAAWADARARMTDVGRLGDLLDSAAERLVHVQLDRVSPLAVPVLVMIGRESLPQGAVDDELLLEAETLASAAMRIEPAAEPEDEDR